MSTEARAIGSVARGFAGIGEFSWPLRRSSEVLELRYGKALVESSRRLGSVPVYGTNGQTGVHDEALFTGPGVIVGRKGAGHLGVHWSQEDFWVIDTAYALIPTPDVDLKFAYYLISYVGLDHLKHGTSNPSLTREVFGAQYFPVPPLETQRAIAEVLGSIDDKIAANAKLISTADELSRLKFESLLDVSRFTPLTSLARFVNGKAFTKGASGTGRVVIRIAELNSGLGASTVYNNVDVGEDHLARPGDLLFAWSGSLTVHRWFRPEGIINQHIFKVIPINGPMWVVKGALDRKLTEFRAIAADKATTMGHIQRHHLDEPVEVPIDETIQAINAAMDALWQRTLIAEQESLQLAVTRDALLPLLMSGKIRVEDAESVVEGVV